MRFRYDASQTPRKPLQSILSGSIGFDPVPLPPMTRNRAFSERLPAFPAFSVPTFIYLKTIDHFQRIQRQKRPRASQFRAKLLKRLPADAVEIQHVCENSNSKLSHPPALALVAPVVRWDQESQENQERIAGNLLNGFEIYVFAAIAGG